MNLSNPPPNYDRANEADTRSQISRAIANQEAAIALLRTKRPEITTQANFDSPSAVPAGDGYHYDIAVPGAVLGDAVTFLSYNQDTDDLIITALVKEDDLVRVQLYNRTGSDITPDPGRWYVAVTPRYFGT